MFLYSAAEKEHLFEMLLAQSFKLAFLRTQSMSVIHYASLAVMTRPQSLSFCVWLPLNHA